MMTPNAERLAAALIEAGILYRFGPGGPGDTLVSCGVQDMVDVSAFLDAAALILARSPDPAHRAAVAESTRLQQALSDMTGRYEALLRDHHPTYSVDNTPLGRRKWIIAEFERLTSDLVCVMSDVDIVEADAKAYSWLVVAQSRVRVLSDLFKSIYPEIQQSGCSDPAKGTDWDGVSLVTKLRSYPAAPPGADAAAVSYPAGLMVQAADQIETLQAQVATLTKAKTGGLRAALVELDQAADDILISLPGHWHDDATIRLTDAAADAKVALQAAEQDDLYSLDWAGASGLTWNSPLELPPEAGRGLDGQVMDAAWPEFGGNNAPAEFWHAFALAVRFTIEATKPPGSGMNPEGERLYRAAMARTMASLPDPEDRAPAALADCIRFLEAWVPDTFPATDAGQIPFGRALLESAIDSMRATLAGTQTYTLSTLQTRYQAWMAKVCEGDPTDLTERCARAAEEFFELMQALEFPRASLYDVIDYSYSRPIGEPAAEMGGAVTTLAALAEFVGLDMAACGGAELARVNTPEMIAKVRGKRSRRHGRGVLPGTEADLIPAPVDALREKHEYDMHDLYGSNWPNVVEAAVERGLVPTMPLGKMVDRVFGPGAEADAIALHLTEHRPDVVQAADHVGLTFELYSEASEFVQLMSKLPPASASSGEA